MLTKSIPHRIYRLSAWYDLLVTWPFATPITLAFFWGTLMSPLNVSLGLGALPHLDIHAVLFANFFGTVVIIWSVVRLVWDDPALAPFDGIGRLFFSAWMGGALAAGITPLVWIFLIPELIFAVAQIGGIFGASSRENEEQLR